MNNKKLVGIISAVAGAVLFTLSLVFYILSFGSEDYAEYGAEFWADSDYLVFMIIGISYSVYGIITVLKEGTEGFNFVKATTFTLAFTGFIDLAYCFGKFFKAIAKGNGFDAWHFNFGLAGLLLLGLGILVYYMNKKKEITTK